MAGEPQTQPTPTQPAPTQPTPTQPAPTQPAPTQPAPQGPAAETPQDPVAITPDDKDWTWTLQRRCPECGLAAGEVDPAEVGERALIAAVEWVQILTSSPAVSARPEPQVWSALEYGAHVRDVIAVMERRLHLMVETDDPLFENWDQDRTAVEQRYGEQDPDVVAQELLAEAEGLAGWVAGLSPEQFGRIGRRSNGSLFTVATLLQYFLHDVIHHLWDVTGQPDATTSLEPA